LRIGCVRECRGKINARRKTLAPVHPNSYRVFGA
jgi:hypothetical protein